MTHWFVSEYGSPLHCRVADWDAIGTHQTTEIDIPGVGVREVCGLRLTEKWPGARIGSIARPTPPSVESVAYRALVREQGTQRGVR
jgi:hypothetical protein